jgi:hypothetical protein
MSFRLTNAMTCLMDMMNKFFMEYLDKFIIVLIDGILVYSKIKEEHEEHFCLVLLKLQHHRFYAKLSTCEFWLKQVAFLGHVISKRGISVDPRKIQDVLSWNAPASVADNRSLLGLIGYYQRPVEGFLNITKPITELLGKDKKFKWTPTCEARF